MGSALSLIGLGDRFADRPPYRTDHRRENCRRNNRAKWATAKKITVDRRNLLAQQKTRATKTAHTSRDRYPRRAGSSDRKDRNNNQVVAKAITNVLRDN